MGRKEMEAKKCKGNGGPSVDVVVVVVIEGSVSGGGTGINQPGHAGPRMSESRDLAGNAWGALRTCPAGTVWWHVRITPDVVDSEALYRKAAFSSV